MQVGDRHLRDIWISTLLTWWASEPAGRDYTHVVSMAWATLGIRATIPEAKREVKACLRAVGLLPRHRIPTSTDYERAKHRWLQRAADQDLV